MRWIGLKSRTSIRARRRRIKNPSEWGGVDYIYRYRSTYLGHATTCDTSDLIYSICLLLHPFLYSMEFLAHYCFMSAFSYALLTEGYGFEPGRNLTVRGKIDGLKVTWALGAMLYEINALPWEYVRPPTWVAAFVGSFLLNILLFMGMIFFLRKAHLSATAIVSRRRSLSSQALNGSKPSNSRMNSGSYQQVPSDTNSRSSYV